MKAIVCFSLSWILHSEYVFSKSVALPPSHWSTPTSIEDSRAKWPNRAVLSKGKLRQQAGASPTPDCQLDLLLKPLSKQRRKGPSGLGWALLLHTIALPVPWWCREGWGPGGVNLLWSGKCSKVGGLSRAWLAQLMSIFVLFGFCVPLFIFALTAQTDFWSCPKLTFFLLPPRLSSLCFSLEIISQFLPSVASKVSRAAEL